MLLGLFNDICPNFVSPNLCNLWIRLDTGLAGT